MSASARAGITSFAIAPFVWALTVGACADSTEPESSPLALAEATAMFVGLRSSVSDTTFVPVFVSADSIVVRCPFGGRARLVGSVVGTPPVSDTVRLVSEFEIAPVNCGFIGQGFRFTVSGNPSIRDVTAIVTVLNENLRPVLEGGLSGALDWELAGRTGTCEMDLTLSGSLGVPGAPSTSTARYAGTMCGYEVDFDASGFISPPGG